MRLARPGVLLALLALVGALAACGGDGEQEAAELDTAEPTAADAPAEAAAEGAETGGDLALRLVRVAQGLDSPVYLASTRSEGGKLFVVEQTGRIRVIANGRVQAGAFLDIRSLVSCCGERGLLSMAFHPKYKKNRLFYVNYTDRNGDTVVAEYRARNRGAPVRTRALLLVRQPYSNHNGGQLQFAPNGTLFVGMGDGGAANDPENRAQDPSSQHGKLLRLNVNKPGARWRVVAYGLRNPWRFSFDRKTGALYIADVGQGKWEEIDYVPRKSPGVENYGWDVFEGTHRFENKQPTGNGRLVPPIHEYDHSQGCSVTGGYVYRGKAIPEAVGRYFFGDYCTGKIWSLVVRNGRATDVQEHDIEVKNLTSFGESRSGELFLLAQNGEIFRLARG